MSEAPSVPKSWRRVAPVVMSSLILIGAGTQLPAFSVFAVDAPEPTAVECGQVLDTSVLVTNDLSDCLADGLVNGAPGITVALDGHTIDGVGLGAGVLNDGHHEVTVTGGTLREFDVGVLLNPGTADNVVSHLDVELNQEAGVRPRRFPDDPPNALTVDHVHHVYRRFTRLRSLVNRPPGW